MPVGLMTSLESFHPCHSSILAGTGRVLRIGLACVHIKLFTKVVSSESLVRLPLKQSHALSGSRFQNGTGSRAIRFTWMATLQTNS